MHVKCVLQYTSGAHSENDNNVGQNLRFIFLLQQLSQRTVVKLNWTNFTLHFITAPKRNDSRRISDETLFDAPFVPQASKYATKAYSETSSTPALYRDDTLTSTY